MNGFIGEGGASATCAAEFAASLRITRFDESGVAASPGDDPELQRAVTIVQRLPRPLLLELSPAERRVLVYLCAGWSNKEIASELGRAEATIKHQVSGCLRKMGQPSRARLIAALR